MLEDTHRAATPAVSHENPCSILYTRVSSAAPIGGPPTDRSFNYSTQNLKIYGADEEISRLLIPVNASVVFSRSTSFITQEPQVKASYRRHSSRLLRVC